MNWLRQIFCAHHYEFLHNLYGDQIIEWGYKRSVWQCQHCGRLKGRDELHDDGDLLGVAGPLPEHGWD